MQFNLLTSASKTKIFEMLVRFSTPICLRDIASLTGTNLRSTQLALCDFQRLRVVHVYRESNRAMYEIVESPIIEAYRELFEKEAQQRIRIMAKKNARKAQMLIAILQDLHNVSTVINQMKSNR